MERKRPGSFNFVGPLWDVLDRWKTANQSLGGQSRALFETWVKCRSADLEKGMQFYTDMASCRDPAMMLHLQQRWLLETANRLQAEFQQLGEKIAGLATGSTDETPAPAQERDAAE